MVTECAISAGWLTVAASAQAASGRSRTRCFIGLSAVVDKQSIRPERDRLRSASGPVILEFPRFFMANIFPFQAYRYTSKAGALQGVVTQPYDKISPEMQQGYL